jgi:hypothetical protein
VRTPRLPAIAYHIEQRGGRSGWAERIRERHRQSVAQAAARLAEPAGPAADSWLERVRTQARVAWLALRRELPDLQAGVAQSAARQPEHAPQSKLNSERASPAMDELTQQALQRWKAYRQAELANLDRQVKSKAWQDSCSPTEAWTLIWSFDARGDRV